jgi:nucleoside-diphosphate-sugar epimerase
MSGIPERVVITGAGGNLGRKLRAAFEAASWCRSIVAIDHADLEPDRAPGTKTVAVRADLADRQDRRWIDAIQGADAIVHLAAQNPYPDASWLNSLASFDMTLNLLGAAEAGGVRRFVFISSNHVMGGYKDVVPALAAGALTEALAPMPGTRTCDANGRVSQSPAYAVHKLMGERLCRERAIGSGGRLSTVSLRVGWCQPGENHPDTLNASGIPGDGVPADDAEMIRDMLWFRRMWLSNADFVQIVERAVLARASAWPTPAIVINAMSDNAGMVWDLAAARGHLGYSPRDGVRPHSMTAA